MFQHSDNSQYNYDNNDVQIFRRDGSTDLSSSGELFSDPLEGVAFFVTYANPKAPP